MAIVAELQPDEMTQAARSVHTLWTYFSRAVIVQPPNDPLVISKQRACIYAPPFPEFGNNRPLKVMFIAVCCAKEYFGGLSDGSALRK